MGMVVKNRLLLLGITVFLSTCSTIYAGALDSKKDYVHKVEKVEIEPARNVEQEKINSINYLPYLEVGGKRFFEASYKYADSFDLFIPFWQSSRKILFSSLKIYDRSGRAYDNSAYLGYRQLSLDRESLYGIYAGYDYKKSAYGNYFNKLIVGAEFWRNNLFIGGNFYQPVGVASKFIDSVSSGTITTTRHENAMRGGELEIGYQFNRGLIGYVGGYYFKAQDVPTICGPKVRMTYDWYPKNGKRILSVFDKFGLEAGIQRDNPRGTIWHVGANFRVSLMPNKIADLYGVKQHMVDLVRRDYIEQEIVFVDQKSSDLLLLSSADPASLLKPEVVVDHDLAKASPPETDVIVNPDSAQALPSKSDAAVDQGLVTESATSNPRKGKTTYTRYKIPPRRK